MIDLLSFAVGGRVVACNDEFFAEASNLLEPRDPVFDPDAYTDRGKLMDGWETRRRREPGHDWCVLALGIPGCVRQVTVDTSYFTGNFPEAFSLDACGVGSDDRVGDASWVEMIPRTGLSGDSMLTIEPDMQERVTHLRLNIYPDGGVARLRVSGDPIPARDDVCPGTVVDLVTSRVGGIALDASDHHYSLPSNLLSPTEPKGMWDGWETRRRRGPGHDWATFRLGLSGSIEAVVVDTRHFKGNAPGSVSIHLSEDGESWARVVDQEPVLADTINQIAVTGRPRAGWVKVDIHPDGGIARLRVLGRPDPTSAETERVRYLNHLFPSEAASFFHTACTSASWVDGMVRGRPYPDGPAVMQRSREVFGELDETDWLEAFAGHPRIGERGDEMANKEQAGVATASGTVIERLVDVNALYASKFGFSYIVYASGKTAEEMLEIAERRLDNERAAELEQAAAEQTAITETRLASMLCMDPK
jgi:allantoicase